MDIRNLKPSDKKLLFNRLLHFTTICSIIFLLYYLIGTSAEHMKKQENFYKALEIHMQSEEKTFDSIDVEIAEIHIKIDSLLCQ